MAFLIHKLHYQVFSCSGPCYYIINIGERFHLTIFMLYTIVTPYIPNLAYISVCSVNYLQIRRVLELAWLYYVAILNWSK